jgi:hypothetical protein
VTPTVTPTVDPRDAYEPDDVTPKPIAVGETQVHNFYPNGDVDKETFVAKGARRYQVLTADLALGVDTLITVVQSNKTWVNDDYASGTGNFASAVCFEAPADGAAVVTTVNKAQYGSDKRYTLKVSEIANLNTSPCNAASSTPVSQRMLDDRLVFGASLPAAFSKPFVAQDRQLKPIALVPPNVRPAAPEDLPFRFVIVVELKVTP